MDQVVGPYRLIELLGGGGQADVYLGEHQETGDRHALKILHAGLSVDADAKSAFLQEAIKARSVEHENIVEIIDVGEHEGRPFMVLEYVSNDLASLIAGTPLDEKRAIEIARQVADALAYAHSLGIVHRDIKPQNILVNQAGQVKVADFGISASAFMATIGRTGEVLGTPAYMSPEQWTGEPDHRSDIYSLGVVIYEMLTGSPPFESNTTMGWLEAHRTRKIPLPAKMVNELPDFLIEIIEKCLEKDPKRRFQSAEELSTALRLGVVRNSPMLIPEFAWEAMPSPWRRTITRGLRNGKRAAITAGAIGAVAAIIVPTAIFVRNSTGTTPEVEVPTFVDFELRSTQNQQVIFAEIPTDVAQLIGVSRVFMDVPAGPAGRELSISATTTPLQGEPPGAVIEKFVSINLALQDDEREVSATVEFTAGRTWLADQGIDSELLRLFRYSDGWKSLPTELLGSTDEVFLLRSSTPGFSIFAIGALTEVEVTPTPLPPEVDVSVEVPTATPEPTPVFLGTSDVTEDSAAMLVIPTATAEAESSATQIPTPTEAVATLVPTDPTDPAVPTSQAAVPTATAVVPTEVVGAAPEPVTALPRPIVSVSPVSIIEGVAGSEVLLQIAAHLEIASDSIQLAEIAWGDGVAVEGQVRDDFVIRATHTYASPGVYTIAVLISTELGGLTSVFVSAVIEDVVAVSTASPTVPVPTATRPAPRRTATPTRLPAPNPTPLPTATVAPIPTSVPSPTPVASPTPTPQPVPVPTPTILPTATATALPTSTPTQTPTATMEPSPTPTATVEPVPLVVTELLDGQMDAGTTELMTINGSGFADGIFVEFEGGSGPDPEVNVTLIEPERIELRITAKSGGPSGMRVWDMLVTGSDGQSVVLLDALIITR